MSMEVSKKISSLQVSPTVALNSKAKQLKASGADVLNFAVGEPDYGTPQQVIDIAVNALKTGKTKYGPAGGGLPFRTAISEKLSRENGLDYPPEQIVCGIGAKEILFHISLSLLNDGDEVLLTAPFWVSYQDQIKAAGGVPVLIPMTDGKPCFDPEVIEKYSSPRTVAYLLCSPNNPAGYALSHDELQVLGNYLAEKNWWVISDEIYEYLTFDTPHTSLLKACPQLREQYILVNGMSKSFAMTGWRVGYCCGPTKVMKLVKSLQSHSSTCLPPFIEEAACWAIKQGASLMSEQLSLLKARRDLAVDCIKAIKGLSYIQPQGAFYLFIDVRPALKSSTKFGDDDSMAFCEYLLEEKHIAVVPGEAFGSPGYLRLSYATDENTIRKGTQRLQEAVEAI